VREGRRGLEAKREREGRPIARDRADRLFEACRRLEEELDVEHASHAAYDAWRARGVAADGSRRMAPGMVKPHEPVLVPTGLINLTDHDSRPMRTHGYKPLQGYNAQLAVNERQVVIAAELTTDSPDFGHLEPMVAPRNESFVGSRSATRALCLPTLATGSSARSRRSSATASRCSCHRTPVCGKGLARAGRAGFMTSCGGCSRRRTAGRSTADARRRSSRCSGS